MVINIYNGILTIKNKFLPFWQMVGESGGCYAKWNKSDREMQLLYNLTYIWNLKNKQEMKIDS